MTVTSPALPAARHIFRGLAARAIVRWGAWLLVAPGLAFMVLFCVYPLLRLFLLSLGPSHMSLDNYVRLFTAGAYPKVLANTFIVSGGITALCLVVGYPTAYGLSQLVSQSWQRRLMALVVVPYLTSQLVRIYAWKVLLGDDGPINRLALALRVSDAPLPLLYNTFGMVIGMIHIMLPLMILPLYATMRGIDPALTRAATAMGAAPLRAFASVFLPLSLPGVRSGCVLVFVATLGAYIIPAGLGGLGNAMVSNLIQSQVEGSLNFGLAGAAAFVLLAVTLIALAVAGGDAVGLHGAGEQRKPLGRSRSRAASRLARAGAEWTGMTKWSARLNGWLWRRRRSRARLSGGLRHKAISVVMLAVLGFLVAPIIIVVWISFSSDTFLSFPPASYSLRWYEAYLRSPQWRSATALSFFIAFLSAGASLLLGLAAAYALSRGRLEGKRAILALLLAPMIIPAVVSGIAIFGTLADWHLVGTPEAILIAHTIGSIAFVVVVGLSTLAGLDQRLEQAAMSLGARPLTIFLRVVAPLMLPGIVAGGLFAFIHSFDEVIITSFVSGTRLETLPVKMWNDMMLEVDPTIAAVSTLLVVLPLLWLLIMEAMGASRAEGGWMR